MHNALFIIVTHFNRDAFIKKYVVNCDVATFVSKAITLIIIS